MKRKRGHKKKGKSKKQKLLSTSTATAVATTAAESPNNDVESANTYEENSESEEDNDDVQEGNGNLEEGSKATTTTKIEEETPQEKKEQVANLRTDGVFVRPPPTAVYGRVRVKLKAMQKPPLETKAVASSEGQIQNDVGTSSQVVDVVGKKEDRDVVVVDDDEKEDSSKKSATIKIVSSNRSSPSGGKESAASGFSPDHKQAEESEAKLPPREAKYNRQELEASLEVLKKIMKMDAAEPFNVPVDPVKLGIPDYFEVIDTPMDFGSIRKNLESGTKYMNSEDVFKDVQCVWDNCYKYNNKGDYIVDLMKRVKKNFMKYWAAAELYNEQSKKIKGDESSPSNEPATSGQGKKLKKGKGFKRHKDDCLCAICIMKRRRREREAREAQAAREAGVDTASPHVKLSKAGLHEEYKQEEILQTESPVADTSSYMETSPDGDVDAEMEDGEMRPEAISPQYINDQKLEGDRADLYEKSEKSGDISEKSIQSDKGDAELYSHIETRVQDESGNRMKIDAQKPPLLLPEGQTAGYLQQRNELLELEKKRQKLRMLETFRDLENPVLLGLCGTLFPNNTQSIWSGANSLVRCKKSSHRRDIHEAVASFTNTPCKSASSLK